MAVYFNVSLINESRRSSSVQKLIVLFVLLSIENYTRRTMWSSAISFRSALKVKSPFTQKV